MQTFFFCLWRRGIGPKFCTSVIPFIENQNGLLLHMQVKPTSFRLGEQKTIVGSSYMSVMIFGELACEMCCEKCGCHHGSLYELDRNPEIQDSVQEPSQTPQRRILCTYTTENSFEVLFVAANAPSWCSTARHVLQTDRAVPFELFFCNHTNQVKPALNALQRHEMSTFGRTSKRTSSHSSGHNLDWAAAPDQVCVSPLGSVLPECTRARQSRAPFPLGVFAACRANCLQSVGLSAGIFTVHEHQSKGALKLHRVLLLLEYDTTWCALQTCTSKSEKTLFPLYDTCVQNSSRGCECKTEEIRAEQTASGSDQVDAKIVCFVFVFPV